MRARISGKKVNEDWAKEHDQLIDEFNTLQEKATKGEADFKEVKEQLRILKAYSEKEEKEWTEKYQKLEAQHKEITVEVGALKKRGLSPGPESEKKRLLTDNEDLRKRLTLLESNNKELGATKQRLTLAEAERAAAKKKLLEIQGENDSLTLKVEQLDAEVSSRPTSQLPDAPPEPTEGEKQKEKLLRQHVEENRRLQLVLKDEERKSQNAEIRASELVTEKRKLQGELKELERKRALEPLRRLAAPEAFIGKAATTATWAQAIENHWANFCKVILTLIPLDFHKWNKEEDLPSLAKGAAESLQNYVIATIRKDELAPLRNLHPQLQRLETPRELAAGIVECVAFALASLWQQLPHDPKETLLTPQTQLESLLARIETAATKLKLGQDPEKEELRKRLSAKEKGATSAQELKELQRLVKTLLKALA
jgi:hypothetical protein